MRKFVNYYTFKNLIISHLSVFWFLVLVFYLPACTGNARQAEAGKKVPELIQMDSSLFLNHYLLNGKDSQWRGDLLCWYQRQGYHLAWYRSGELIEYANYLLQLSRDGQEPADTNLNRMVEDISVQLENLPPVSDSSFVLKALDIDISLSLLFLNYARQHWIGLGSEDRLKTGWHIEGLVKDPILILDDFLKDADHSSFQRKMVYAQHGKLEAQLGRLRKIQASGAWPEIRWPGRDLKENDTASILADIRTYLFLNGDLRENSRLNILDSTLQEGIRAFQARHGIRQNCLPDKSTIRAMGYSIAERIRQVQVNMERCRWLPPEPKGKYLAVNIPDFRLMVFDNQQLQWSCNAVVGKEKTGTVIFSNELQFVVFSPYWNIPRSILVNEILPKQRNNPGYLASQNMEVYTHTGKVISANSIDWSQYWGSAFPYNIRQKPGGKNALGRVKFLFPNEHNIYLHDTPSKSLFAESKRAFSHGCIRIQEPVRLAKYLLKDDPEWTDEKIEAAMNQDKEQQVSLKERIPVFIAYFTSWVDASGKLHFREDIYKHDEKLAAILFAKD